MLGEIHDRYDKCNMCKKNCIEIEYIVPYLMYCISPILLDLYIEMEHTYIKEYYILPDKTDKTNNTRISKIYAWIL